MHENVAEHRYMEDTGKFLEAMKMKRNSQRLLLFIVKIAFLVLLFLSNVSYAAIINPPNSVDSPLTQSEIAETANAAVAMYAFA